MRNAIAVTLIAMSLGGCCAGPEYVTAPDCPPLDYADPSNCPPQQGVPVEQQPAPIVTHANPVFIPIADHDCAWEQVVDVVDDYFRIDHEEPVRAVGNMVTEGSIVTLPEVSPTIFEPWRRDTVDPEQRMENTLQSMRRRAVVRVIPAQGGHMVDVQVYKDLEDMVRPDNSTAGAATFRYDSTLTGVTDPIGGQPPTKGWIPRGRDASLEQYIIGDLLSRCNQPLPGPVVMRGQDATRK